MQKQFVKNSYVSSVDLTNGINFEELIACDLIDKASLTLDEQLDFQNRQTKYIAPHVLMKGYEYKTPFLYQPWVDFMLSVPNSFRSEQSLYKKILLHSFPKEFSYKTKQTLAYHLVHQKMLFLLKEKLINF